MTEAKYINKPWQGKLESLVSSSLEADLKIVSGIYADKLSLTDENELFV